jgi:hypothetical protein
MSARVYFDAFGQRLEIGRRIAYPVRRSDKASKTHVMELKSARIEALIPNAQEPGECVIMARNPQQRPVRLMKASRVVLLPEGLPQ